MSSSPSTESAESHEQPSPNESQPSARWLKASQWPMYAALALSVIAVILAALAYFHPRHNSASAAQQGGDAKSNVCSAYVGAKKAVVISTHMQSPNPNDAGAELGVATNARLALLGGGAYLRERLAANTAAPADLAKAVNSMADTIEQLSINYMVGAGNDVQDPLRHDLNSEIAQIDKLCA